MKKNAKNALGPILVIIFSILKNVEALTIKLESGKILDNTYITNTTIYDLKKEFPIAKHFVLEGTNMPIEETKLLRDITRPLEISLGNLIIQELLVPHPLKLHETGKTIKEKYGLKEMYILESNKDLEDDMSALFMIGKTLSIKKPSARSSLIKSARTLNSKGLKDSDQDDKEALDIDKIPKDPCEMGIGICVDTKDISTQTNPRRITDIDSYKAWIQEQKIYGMDKFGNRKPRHICKFKIDLIPINQAREYGRLFTNEEITDLVKKSLWNATIGSQTSSAFLDFVGLKSATLGANKALGQIDKDKGL